MRAAAKKSRETPLRQEMMRHGMLMAMQLSLAFVEQLQVLPAIA
jgi:hypothetical protein